jgi:hypothetical protein
MCRKINRLDVASGIISLDYHYDTGKRVPDVKMSNCPNEGGRKLYINWTLTHSILFSYFYKYLAI